MTLGRMSYLFRELCGGLSMCCGEFVVFGFHFRQTLLYWIEQVAQTVALQRQHLQIIVSTNRHLNHISMFFLLAFVLHSQPTSIVLIPMIFEPTQNKQFYRKQKNFWKKKKKNTIANSSSNFSTALLDRCLLSDFVVVVLLVLLALLVLVVFFKAFET